MRNTIKLVESGFIILLLSLFFSGCVKYDTPLVDKPLSIADKVISFEAIGGEKLLAGSKNEGSLKVSSITVDGVSVRDDGDPKTPLNNLWCSVTNDYESMGIIISLMPNDTGKERTCTISCSNSYNSRFGAVTIQQSR